MPQRTIRFSETTLQQIQQAAKQKGFASSRIGLGVNNRGDVRASGTRTILFPPIVNEP